MAGVVYDSQLVSEGVSVGMPGDKYFQHHLTIKPFRQELVRDVSVLLQTMDLPQFGVLGSYSALGFAFVTRGQGKAPATAHVHGYSVPKMEPDGSDHDDDLFADDDLPLVRKISVKDSTKAVINYEDVGQKYLTTNVLFAIVLNTPLSLITSGKSGVAGPSLPKTTGPLSAKSTRSRK
ncbi:hypothetical protein DXG01_015856 [Tephrocybe rancida]|nr:hypothetical protein DXG01_015856 [Tephrocybe rancida]